MQIWTARKLSFAAWYAEVCLLMRDGNPFVDMSCTQEVVNREHDAIAAANIAVDCQIKQRTIMQSGMLTKSTAKQVRVSSEDERPLLESLG